MQDVVGLVVLIIVLLIALASTVNTARDEGMSNVAQPIIFFIVIVIVCYLGLGVILGIIYVIAWFGTIIREMLMWFIEGILKPFAWIIPG